MRKNTDRDESQSVIGMFQGTMNQSTLAMDAMGYVLLGYYASFRKTKPSFFGYVATMSFQFLLEKNSLRNSLESGPQIG